MLYYLLFTLLYGTISLSILYKIIRNLRRLSINLDSKAYMPIHEAPSVTICIPVRNESHAIRDCLERVMSSNYPKLEVLVLDDESVDNTPFIVKAFAHDGVRFIKGRTLPEGWVGKNNALDQLARDANGKYIFFMGVDTKVKSDTISRLVSIAQSSQSKMVSIVPQRLDSHRPNAVFGTLRYFGEVLFHTKATPAISTGAWLVEREALEKLSYFEFFKSELVPEDILAQIFAKQNAHRSIMSNNQLGISVEKKWESQVDTAIRTLHSSLKSINRLMPYIMVLLLMIVNAGVGLSLYKFISLKFDIWFWALLGSHTIIGVAYSLFCYKFWGKNFWLGFLVWPFVVAQELILTVLSITRYHAGILTWKGRELRLD